MSIDSIDLTQYGMHWRLDKSSNKPAPDNFLALTNVATSHSQIFKYGTITFHYGGANVSVYTIGDRIGSGAYGQVYECTRNRDSLKAVIKVVENVSLMELIKETIIQIIIVESTKHKKHPQMNLSGPYAPVVYEIGYDDARRRGFIVSERMHNTVYNLYNSHQAKPGELKNIVNTVMVQISTMLSELYTMLSFNHRDFKTDNCMYIHDAKNNINAKIIDFGYSYIQWQSLIISCENMGFKNNTLPARDMTQFIYETLKFHPYIPADSNKVLQDLVTFKLPNGKICKMYKGCPGVTEWKNTYGFLNSATVVNLNGSADVVKNVYELVIKNQDYKPALAWAPGKNSSVPTEKIYNSDTGYHVDSKGPFYQVLMQQIQDAKTADRAAVAAGLGVKLCPEDYNPRTKRCVKACGAGKERNMTTFRCIVNKKRKAVAASRKGRAAASRKRKAVVAKPVVAKPVVAKPGVAKPVKAVAKAVKAAPKPKVSSKEARIKMGLKPCLDKKKPDYNPKTRRCVMACPPNKYRNRTTFKCESIPTDF